MPRSPRAEVASDHFFKVRVTAEELKAIAGRARDAGVSASELFRAWLAGAPHIVATKREEAVEQAEVDIVATEPAAPAPMTDAVARPRPGVEPELCSRWSPRHVWTLHRVPGRLDGPPLAVRRRVLRDGESGDVAPDYADMEIDTPMSRLSVREARLRHLGEARSDGSLREDDDGATLELSLDVFDHCPTPEERAEWLRKRLLEQALLKAPPSHVWITLPGRPGDPSPEPLRFGAVPDRAVRCAVEWGGRRYRGEVIVPRRQQGSGDPRRGPEIDMRNLAVVGVVKSNWGEIRKIWLHRPDAADLDWEGELRAQDEQFRRRREEEARRSAEGFADTFRRAREAAAAPPPGLAALKELGLDASASAEDIKAAYRQKAKATHPDHGGTGDMGRLRELRDLALAYVQGAA